MTSIIYQQGDATDPKGEGKKIIAHICNDAGEWGAGFVLALSARWTQPEKSFKRWAKSAKEQPFKLGETMLVQVEDDLYVANMIAQRDIVRDDLNNIPPIRYNALSKCLAALAREALRLNASVHMPRIGTGLAEGKWDEIEPLLYQHLIDNGIAVTVYDFDPIN